MTFRTIARRGYSFNFSKNYDGVINTLQNKLFWLKTKETGVAVTATNALYTGGISGELLVDGGFETWSSSTNLTNWSELISGSTTINQESTIKRSGSFSCRIDVDGSNSGTGVFQTSLPGVAKGDTIRLSVWARRGAVAASMRLGAGSNFSGTQTLTTTFEQFSSDVVNDGSSSHALQFYRLSATNASIYFDDASALKVGELDGSITTSGVVIAQNGILGNSSAFDLDGTNGGLTIYERASINGLPIWYFQILLRPDTLTANDRILFKSGEIDCLIDGSGFVDTTANYSGTNAQSTSSIALQTGQWQLLEVYLDSSDNIVHYRINGVQRDDATPQVGIGTRSSTTNNLLIGKNASTNAFDGLISNPLLASSIPSNAKSSQIASALGL